VKHVLDRRPDRFPGAVAELDAQDPLRGHSRQVGVGGAAATVVPDVEEQAAVGPVGQADDLPGGPHVGDRGHGRELQRHMQASLLRPVAQVTERRRGDLGRRHCAEVDGDEGLGPEGARHVEEPVGLVDRVQPRLLGGRGRAEPVADGLDVLDPHAVVGQQRTEVGIAQAVPLDGPPMGVGHDRHAVEAGGRGGGDHVLQRQVDHRHVAQHQLVAEPPGRHATPPRVAIPSPPLTYLLTLF
jgi:hypothetical protein